MSSKDRTVREAGPTPTPALVFQFSCPHHQGWPNTDNTSSWLPAQNSVHLKGGLGFHILRYCPSTETPKSCQRQGRIRNLSREARPAARPATQPKNDLVCAYSVLLLQAWVNLWGRIKKSKNEQKPWKRNKLNITS